MADVQAVNIWTGTEWVEIAQPIADGGNVGDVLTWSGSEWAAAAPGGLPIGTAEGQLLQWDGAGWNTTGEGNADGQLLVWDDLNKRWTPMAYTGTDGNGKPIKPILPIGSEDGTVMLADAAGSFSVQDTSSPGSPDLIATFHPDSKPTMAGMMLKQSWLTQDGKVLMWEPGTAREPVVPTDDAQAVPKKYVDDLVADSVADHKLPTESVDGTVVLDSPAADTFTIETGGTERLRVDAAGHVAVNCIPRSNTQFEVKSDAASPFVTIFDGSSSTDYDGRSGWRLYNGSLLCDFAIDPVSLTYGFSGGNSGGSQIIPGGMTHADIEIKPKNWVKLNEPLMVPSGTAAAPSYAFIGDPDTGTFSPAADTFAISTGGTERLRVDAAGRLLVGLQGPAVNQNYNWHFQTDGNNQLVVDSKTGDPLIKWQFGTQSWYGRVDSATGQQRWYHYNGTATRDGMRLLPDSGGAIMPGSFRCNTYTTYDGAVGDATIDLNGQVMTVSTAGTEALRVGPFGTVGIGTIAAPATARSALLYVRGTPNRPDSSAGIFSLDATVSQTQAFGVYLDLTVGDGTTLGAFIASDVKGVSAAGSGVVDRFIGYRVRNIAAGATDITAFESNINLDGSNTRYAFHAAGSAPSKFGGWIEGIDGSSATPAYTFAGDLDTGAFRPTTDTFAISTAGTERLRVGPTGQITAAAGYTPVAEQDLATRKFVEDQVALGGGASVTTADVNLTNPTRSLGRYTPPTGLATQEDANQAIGDAIAERKIVLPISRVDYDALPVKDPDTLYLITS